ncbi:MAG: hypothetical protein ABEI74_04920 [Candidatus Pacearchaeota archaeon]
MKEIKEILVSNPVEVELSDEAKKDLEESRNTSISESSSLEEVKERILKK